MHAMIWYSFIQFIRKSSFKETKPETIDSFSALSQPLPIPITFVLMESIVNGQRKEVIKL